MSECRYATAPSDFEVVEIGGRRTAPTPDRFLCAWAQFHPDAPVKLIDAPPWLQRNALAGHLMQDGDCAICPLFEAGEPVE